MSATKTTEGSILKLPTNRMEAIIFLCGFFSFFTTWAGAYKVTSFFSDMPFLGIDKEVLHTGFSLFTAIIIFYIIFAILMNNIEQVSVEARKMVSTTYILAGATVIGLSFWLSVEGLTEGYRNFRTQQILSPYQGQEDLFLGEVQKEILQPVDTLLSRLKAHRVSLKQKENTYLNLDDEIANLDRQIYSQQEQFNRLNSMRVDSIRATYEWRINNLRNSLTGLYKRKEKLQPQRNALREATQLKEINAVTENLSAYRFGKTDPSILVSNISRAETLLSQNIELSFNRDKLEELHEIKTELTYIQTNFHSFLAVIREGLQKGGAGSRGFVILILFFALLGDIVPLLISLKNSNPNTLHGFFKESVRWFHDITDEIAKVDFVRRISRACVGFLFSMDRAEHPDSFKRRYLEPISRWMTLEPMAVAFNFLLAVTIIWGLMSLVIDEPYYLHLSRIFDNWTTDLLTWVEKINF